MSHEPTDHPASVLDRQQVALEYGRVTGCGEGVFTVETDSATVEARKSVNCLIEPLPGDTVLVSQAGWAAGYILAILEREAEAPATLSFGGDVELKSEQGRVRVSAQEGIDVVSAGRTALVSRSLAVHSGEAEVNVPRLSFFGSLLHAQVETIRLLGRACDSVFERVSQRVQRSYRWIEELEHVTAGQLRCLVKKLLSLRGKHSVITAEEDVRIDGDKILMG
ncbi:MAG: DUF3540 domain-containing protein [Planctomycetota bacterium]|jgi:hypothetical protein